MLVLLLGLPAGARSFSLPEADVDIVVRPDGSLLVTERITFDYDGTFSGAYRDIPVAAGETLTGLTVADSDRTYDPGACAELGCSSPAGTFGTRDLGDTMRVVWHYAATDERRTFTITYTMTGVTKAYDDVVDVQFQVWGSEWGVPVGQVTATVAFPGRAAPSEALVWGHPGDVRGTVAITQSPSGGVVATLEAFDVAPGRFAEIRAVAPRSVLTDTSGATTIDGSGREDIISEENRLTEATNRNRRLARVLAVLAGAAIVLPMTVAGTVLWFRHGREPRVDYDREYEQAPPSDHPPALVQALLTQGSVDEKAFTATVFDLIRRGVLQARSTVTDRTTFFGMRSEQITDLEIAEGDDPGGLTAYERSTMTVMDRVLSDGPQPLHEFRDRIRDDAEKNAETYSVFRTKTRDALVSAGLLDRSGTRAVAIAGGSILGVLVLLGLIAAIVIDSSTGIVAIPLLVVAAVVNAVAFGLFVAARRTWVRRTPEGALLAARWKAFRRYLKDFSRLEEAPVISLAVWDLYLVHAITLGVAEEVLTAARLHAPPELEQTSNLYWYGSHGYTSGSTESAFAGITSALSGAFTPPSSGGGGGFSGGGGGGSGGGGGGAW